VSRELREALGAPDTKQRYTRRLFATIADRYDLITVLLSYGRDRAWKRRLVSMSAAGPQTRALDLACGTGDIAFALADRGAAVVGLDVTLRMIQLARQKAAVRGGPALPFIVGDMMTLPFSDASFDLITTGYGIRNVPQIRPAIGEIRRVLRPGGLMLSLDFDRPANPLIRGVYVTYLTIVGSALGWVLHRDPDTYRYIPASIVTYPGASRVASMMEEQGFEACRVLPVLGGLMAINVGIRSATIA
jgi:demethylmenaquinone methyltransferase/2-methoxy-6-polyprenyl-1,4-benzoquinol methylase